MACICSGPSCWWDCYGAFVDVEVDGGFEGKTQDVVGPAFVLFEDEAVDADMERDCCVAEHIESRRAGPGLVATDLGGVGADTFGEGLLGQPRWLRAATSRAATRPVAKSW